jgi:hypothetical protein
MVTSLRRHGLELLIKQAFASPQLVARLLWLPPRSIHRKTSTIRFLTILYVSEQYTGGQKDFRRAEWKARWKYRRRLSVQPFTSRSGTVSQSMGNGVLM